MSINSDNMLGSLLSRCGFSEKESTILEYLYASPPVSAGVISSRTKIKRPTVYAVLESLIEYGFVNRVIRGKTTCFETVRRETLCELIETRARVAYEETADSVAELSEELKKVRTPERRQIGGFSISTLESSESVLGRLKDVLIAGEFCGFFNPQVTIFPETIELVEEFFTESARHKPRIREFAVRGPKADWYVSRIKNPNHKVKLLPESTAITTDILITENSVVLFDYGPGGQRGIAIEQEDYVRSMRALFEQMWEKQ